MERKVFQKTSRNKFVSRGFLEPVVSPKVGEQWWHFMRVAVIM